MLCHELFSFDISLKHSLDDRLGNISQLLLHQQNLEMVGHFRELRSSKGVHEAGFTDTISTNQTIFPTISQFKIGLLEQCFTSNGEMDVIQDEIVVFAGSQSFSSDLHRWQFFLLLLDFLQMLFKVGYSFVFLFVFSLVLLSPFGHFSIAVAGCWLLGEHGLSCILHRKDVL